MNALKLIMIDCQHNTTRSKCYKFIYLFNLLNCSNCVHSLRFILSYVQTKEKLVLTKHLFYQIRSARGSYFQTFIFMILTNPEACRATSVNMVTIHIREIGPLRCSRNSSCPLPNLFKCPFVRDVTTLDRSNIH